MKKNNYWKYFLISIISILTMGKLIVINKSYLIQANATGDLVNVYLSIFLNNLIYFVLGFLLGIYKFIEEWHNSGNWHFDKKKLLTNFLPMFLISIVLYLGNIGLISLSLFIDYFENEMLPLFTGFMLSYALEKK